MTTVVDASVLVAALTDSGPDGVWAESMLARGHLAVPAHVFVEVANVLRRAERSGRVPRASTTAAHADLLDLRVTVASYESVASRVWELRHVLSAYDAASVALAEAFDAPLATLDQRITGANGVRCEFLIPPGRA